MAISFTAGQLVTANELNLLCPTYIIKNVTQSVTNSVTLVNDTDFVWTILPNQSAIIEINLQTANTTTGAGLRLAWTTSGTAGFAARMANGPSDTAAGVTNEHEFQIQGRPLTAATNNLYQLTGTGTYIVRETLVVGGGATGGNVQMQFAQFTANVGSTQVQSGSFGVLRYVS